jgi:hypothetical protein
MKTGIALATFALLALPVLAHADNFTIDFDTDALGKPIADGTTIDEQYAAWGVHFVPNIFAGATNITGFPFADNTDMTATSSDVGFGYDPNDTDPPHPPLGNVLHSFSGWSNEDGDANFAIFFDTPIDSISMDVIGDSSTGTSLYAFDANGVFLGGTFASTMSGFENISISDVGIIGFVAVTPGYYDDWAALDNISFNTVPEPGLAVLLLGSGVCGACLSLRRRHAPSLR